MAQKEDRTLPIPKRCKILAHDITIRLEKDDSELRGLEGAANLHQDIVTVLDPEKFKRAPIRTEATFVEEILHHIGHILNIDWLRGLDDDENHRQVGRLAEALVQVFHTAEL